MGIKDYLPVFEGWLAIGSFLLSSSSLLTMTASPFPLFAIAGTELVYLVALGLFHTHPPVRVILLAHGVGMGFSLGVVLALSREPYAYFGLYVASLAFFHISEYVLTSIFNARTLSLDSFLLNHSMEYGLAILASCAEYIVEYLLFPGVKSLHVVALLGLAMVVFGEALRKTAMVTAGRNFTHVVQHYKRSGHRLVTHGVYSLCRHPSYAGWLCWSVGSQLLLCNPVCTLGFAVASWRFFAARIPNEEELLVQFFREDYVRYMKRVGTGVPMVGGYPVEDAERLLSKM